MVIVVNLENLNFKLFGKWHVSVGSRIPKYYV